MFPSDTGRRSARTRSARPRVLRVAIAFGLLGIGSAAGTYGLAHAGPPVEDATVQIARPTTERHARSAPASAPLVTVARPAIDVVEPAGPPPRPVGPRQLLERDRHSATWQNPDGSRTIETHTRAISFKDARGAWMPFDRRVRVVDGEPSSVGMPFLARFVERGYTWAPDRERPDTRVALGFDWLPHGARWTIDDAASGRMSYRHESTTTVLEVVDDGVKASMLMRDASAPSSWTMRVTVAAPLQLRREDLMVLDGDEPVARIVPPSAVDANGIARDLDWSWSGDRLMMTLDVDGLAYPIDVDPTVSYVGTGANDVAVTGSVGTTISCSIGDVTAPTARYGFTSPNQNMFWMRFPGVMVPRGAIIGSATLDVWDYGSPKQGDVNGAMHYNTAMRSEQSNDAAAWPGCGSIGSRQYLIGEPRAVTYGPAPGNVRWTVDGSTTLVTDRFGWATGNAMAFIASIPNMNTGDFWSTFAMAEDPAADPTLTVTYTPDTTPPTSPVPRDFLLYTWGVDQDYMTSATSLYGDWDTGTDNYKVRGTQVCFTRSSTGADCAGTATPELAPWGNIFANPAVGNTGLALVDQARYYTCARTWDYAGNLSPVACSDGIVSDRSTPATTSVRDGSGIDAELQTSLTTMSANWDAVVDGASGLSHYAYCISTAPACGGTTIKALTTTGTTASMTSTGLSLSSGTRYYVAVYAHDVLGNVSAVTSSNGVLVDAVAPTPNPATGSAVANSTSQITWTITPAIDEAGGSGLHASAYSFDGGSAWASSNVLVSTGLAANTSFTRTVRTRDAAGNATGSTTIVRHTLAAAPSTPTAVSGWQSGDGHYVDLAWTAPAGGASAYRVRSSVDGYAAPIASPTTTTWRAQLLAPMTSYGFRICSVNGDGIEETTCASVAATTPPDAPTALTTTSITDTSARFSWTSPAGADAHRLEVFTDATCTAAFVVAPDATAPHLEEGMSRDRAYHYRVTSYAATSSSWGAPSACTALSSSSGRTELSIEVDTSSVELGSVLVGGTALGSTTVTVGSFGSTGYALLAHVDGPLRTGANTIPDTASGTVGSPPGSGAGDWTGAGFGFTVASATNLETGWSSGTRWAAFPTSATVIHATGTALTPGTDVSTTTRIDYRVQIPAAQPPGNYSTTATYTAVAAP